MNFLSPILAFETQYPSAYVLLIFLPILLAIFSIAEKARGKAMFRFAGGRESGYDRQRMRRFYFLCTITSFGLIIVALSQPAFRKVPHQVSSEGRDLVFLLDVSRSMLAEDLHPNRLDASKQAILDCVKELEGDRIGLVAFAGSSSILCPLTTDYPFFKDKLAEVTPESVYQGGTRIGDAIQKTVDKVLTTDRKGYQDLILISDGGDQESRPEKAAAELEELGVYFIVVGVGDPIQGARVPAREGDEESEGSEFMMFDGKEVWSKLETQSLESLARACRHGVFLEAGRRVLPLGEIYPELVRHFRSQSTGETEEMLDWEETFPIILGIALVFLLVIPLMYRKPKPKPLEVPAEEETATTSEGAAASPAGSSGTATAALILGLFLLAPATTSRAADSPTKIYNQACEQLEAKNFAGTVALFMEAAEGLDSPDLRFRAIYNAGVCSFSQADADAMLDPQSSLVYYQGAIRAFRSCLDLQPDHPDALWNLELSMLRKQFVLKELQDNEDDSQNSEESEESDQSQEGESDESETEDEEGEWEESEEDGATDPSDQSSGPNSMDLESTDIPPPMVDPEDILQQEMENRELRQKQKSSKYKGVEKDW